MNYAHFDSLIKQSIYNNCKLFSKAHDWIGTNLRKFSEVLDEYFRMYLVGLTGGISTGKSTVSSMFSSMGVSIIDADHVARKVVEPGRRALIRLREKFGDDILLEDGTLDRPALAKIIFENASKRQLVNDIVHPEVTREICWQILYKFVTGHKFVILDIPLLFETERWLPYVSKIIVVTCEDDIQIQRLIKRNELSEADAMSRINAQLPLAEKCSKADYIVENSSSIEESQRQVALIYEELRQNWSYLKVRVSAAVITSILVGGVAWLVNRFV